jgi:hypothetical protein
VKKSRNVDGEHVPAQIAVHTLTRWCNVDPWPPGPVSS